MIFLDENNCIVAHVGRVPLGTQTDIRRRRMNERMLHGGPTNFVGISGGVAFFETQPNRLNILPGANLADLKPRVMLSFHSSESVAKLIAILDQERNRLREAGL